MQGKFRRIDSDFTYGECLKELSEVRAKGGVFYVKIDEKKKRTLDQNALKEKQIDFIVNFLGEGEEEVRNKLKYEVGCRILCRDDEDFKAWCDKAFGNFTYEQKVEAMKFVPVTRDMSTTQLSEYLERVYDYYAPVVDWSEFIKDYGNEQTTT